MFTRSPALPASRPSNLIDPRHPAEYPVLLGDALKDLGDHAHTSLSMRYNWKAQKPNSASRMHLGNSKSSSDDSYELIVEDRVQKDKPYRYAGHVLGRSTSRKDKDEDSPSDRSLALIWDPAKSAFLLEPISASLDFNLTSAPDQSQREINAHKKLAASGSAAADTDMGAKTGPILQGSDSDSDPDASNPYDFRHFLAEARENIANGTTGAGSRTPIPGSRTPIPGSRTPNPGSHTPTPSLSSTTPVAQRSTPQFHATSSTSTKKRKLDRPAHTPKAQPKPQTTNRKPTPSSQPLSSERIIDSDEEADFSVLSHVPSAPSNHRAQLSTLNSPALAASPHLIVSDADAELEIDLGSPPPKYTQRKRPHVNPNAFHHRSQANTPRIEQLHSQEDVDVEMTDADVEELELGSPRSGVASRGMSVSTHAGRIEKGGSDPVDAEDDDDGLAAELLEALEEEEEIGEGVGLGISAGREDESEVSEEE